MFAAKVYLASLYGSLRIHLSPNRCRNRRDVVPCDSEFWNRSKRPLNSFRMRGGAGWEKERKGIKRERRRDGKRKRVIVDRTLAVQKKIYGNDKISLVIRSEGSKVDYKRSREPQEYHDNHKLRKICEVFNYISPSCQSESKVRDKTRDDCIARNHRYDETSYF